MLLIILVVVVLIVIVLFIINPVLMLVTQAKLPTVKSKAEIRNNSILCVVTLEDAKSPMFVTSLDAPRSLAEKMGLCPPEGFKEKPLQDRRSAPEWIAKWNKENILFTGKYQIEPNIPVILKFAIKTAPDENLIIKGQFESGRKFGNMVAFFQIKVEK